MNIILIEFVSYKFSVENSTCPILDRCEIYWFGGLLHGVVL
jgi:hypothetical protein